MNLTNPAVGAPLLSLGSREVLAKRVDVDEVFTYQTLGDAIGLGVRFGACTAQKSVPIVDIRIAGRYWPDMLLAVLRELAEDARKKARAELEKTWVSPTYERDRDLDRWLEYKTLELYSTFGLSREQLGLVAEKPDTTLSDRFAAVVAEMEEL